MSNRRRANQDKEMLHVAEMYYFEQMTHAAIAQRLSISRWTVGRITRRLAVRGWSRSQLIIPSPGITGSKPS